MSKIAAMRELAQTRQKKLKAAIVAQQEVVIKLGPRIVSRLEAVWWGHHSKWGQELEREFGRLFYRCGVPPGLQDSYAPITLLQWIRVPNFRVSRFEWPEPIIVKCRRLRESAKKLKEFGAMTFAQARERLEELDRQAREQAQARRQIGG